MSQERKKKRRRKQKETKTRQIQRTKEDLFAQEWLCVWLPHTNIRILVVLPVSSLCHDNTFACVSDRTRNETFPFFARHPVLIASRFCLWVLKWILEVYRISPVCDLTILLFGGHKGAEGALVVGGAGWGILSFRFLLFWCGMTRCGGDGGEGLNH